MFLYIYIYIYIYIHIHTYKCPPTVKEMTNSEEVLRYMIKNLEYRNIKNEFSKKLVDDIKLIKSTTEMLINPDKSRNIYKVSKTYNKNI